ncbi:MAG: DUF1552 domain-containing protein [Opitutaceae bacterium]
MSRRNFLRGAALPMLDAMSPAFAGARKASKAALSGATPRRMLGICNNLGLLPEYFFPTQNGPAYELSPYLQLLKTHRDDFTVFSGVWHPDVDGGHPADNCFLTAAPHPGSGGFRNTISLDQHIATPAVLRPLMEEFEEEPEMLERILGSVREEAQTEERSADEFLGLSEQPAGEDVVTDVEPR